MDIWSVVLCFFFQAEDGIRDYKVTGVQTCALPISVSSGASQGPGSSGPSACFREQGLSRRLSSRSSGRPSRSSLNASFAPPNVLATREPIRGGGGRSRALEDEIRCKIRF